MLNSKMVIITLIRHFTYAGTGFLIDTGKDTLGGISGAVDILQRNVKMNAFFYRDYNLLARAWSLAGNKEEAIRTYRISIVRYDNREEK